jgi:teichuronic acid biosynthesis glycosyltransferase TuaG
MLAIAMTGSEQPLVSVLTPTYNSSRFLGETIESVLAQTYPSIEHLVIDGGSTDDTVEIVERYARENPGRIRLVPNEEEEGVWPRRNMAFLASHGAYICWLDGDDVWTPEKVAKQVDLMQRRPELGLVYSHFRAFDSSSGETLPWSDGAHDWEGDILAALWTKGCFIGALTLMVRREAFNERVMRLSEETFQFGDDYWLLLGVTLDWPAARVDEVLAGYRRHDENASIRFAAQNPTANLAVLMEDFLDVFPEAAGRLGRWRRIGLARNWALASEYERQRGNRVLARRYRMRALRCDPRGLFGEARLDRMLLAESRPPTTARLA